MNHNISLIYIGFFVWLVSVLLDYEFSMPLAVDKGFKDFRHSLGLHFSRQNIMDFGASLGKLTGLAWIGMAAFFEFVLENQIAGFTYFLVIILPAFLGIAAWDRYNLRFRNAR